MQTFNQTKLAEDTVQHLSEDASELIRVLDYLRLSNEPKYRKALSILTRQAVRLTLEAENTIQRPKFRKRKKHKADELTCTESNASDVDSTDGREPRQ